MKNKRLYNIIVILSILGIIISVYLLKNHYDSSNGLGICDINEKVSCSLVNTSVYSELFNIPVSLLGTIWFLLLILFIFFIKKIYLERLILFWSISGILFITYLIIAQIILGALCSFCTIIHIIVIIILILAIKINKNKAKIT